MKKPKAYSVPVDTLNDLDSVSALSRSAKFERASFLVSDGDMISAFAERLASKRPLSLSGRVTLSLDDSTIDRFNEAAERSHLPVEHVIRLALERYISVTGGKVSGSKKESQHATSAGVLTTGVGGSDS